MKIRCEYLDGGVRECSDEYANALKRILGAVENRKGAPYYNFLNSQLSKVYVDDELVLDREKVLEAEKND